MQNDEVASILDEYAALLEPCKELFTTSVRACRRAAELIRSLPSPALELVRGRVADRGTARDRAWSRDPSVVSSPSMVRSPSSSR